MVESAGLHTADLVTGIVGLMLLAALTAIFSARFKKLPFTIGLVLTGIVVGELGRHSSAADFLQYFQLTPDPEAAGYLYYCAYADVLAWVTYRGSIGTVRAKQNNSVDLAPEQG